MRIALSLDKGGNSSSQLYTVWYHSRRPAFHPVSCCHRWRSHFANITQHPLITKHLRCIFYNNHIGAVIKSWSIKTIKWSFFLIFGLIFLPINTISLLFTGPGTEFFFTEVYVWMSGYHHLPSIHSSATLYHTYPRTRWEPAQPNDTLRTLQTCRTGCHTKMRHQTSLSILTAWICIRGLKH